MLESEVTAATFSSIVAVIESGVKSGPASGETIRVRLEVEVSNGSIIPNLDQVTNKSIEYEVLFS